MNKSQQRRALEILDKWERWVELGIEDFLPEFGRDLFHKTADETTALLDSVLGHKPRRTR